MRIIQILLPKYHTLSCIFPATIFSCDRATARIVQPTLRSQSQEAHGRLFFPTPTSPLASPSSSKMAVLHATSPSEQHAPTRSGSQIEASDTPAPAESSVEGAVQLDESSAVSLVLAAESRVGSTRTLSCVLGIALLWIGTGGVP